MNADSGFVWPQGQRCAVSLTYDDGLPVHYEQVGPLLELEGLRATFYVPAMSDVQVHPERWRQLARRGHELGNHSLFHPCTRTTERESWLEPWQDLRTYTLSRWRDELATANLILQLLDDQSIRSFGNTCCETTVGSGDDEVSMMPVLRKLFAAARGPFNRRVVDVRQPVNLYELGHFGADRLTFEEIRDEIEGAAETGGWIIWMIHGVGEGTHGLCIDEVAHEKVVRWLGSRKTDIWTAPLVKVAQHVAFQQQGIAVG
ncbi:MAG: polysaccharide deacetylase family protein [Anaerolineae bacterium]|nr:polysaccharide deacetylase family protein [Anaerolineae bacterium]